MTPTPLPAAVPPNGEDGEGAPVIKGAGAPSPKDLVEARKPLTRREYLQLCIDQMGRCGCGCGVKLDPMGEGVIDEHVIALELTGTNALPNRSLWRKPCSVEKTKRDAKAIAKAKRLAGETGTAPRRPIPQRANPWPPKGARKLQSHPKSRPPIRTEEKR
jgi:hypothetical protein